MWSRASGVMATPKSGVFKDVEVLQRTRETDRRRERHTHKENLHFDVQSSGGTEEKSKKEQRKMTAEMSPALSRRRIRRVLYPAGVRRVLPKEDGDPTRRWLLLLSAILFLQIYTEDGQWDTPRGEGAAGQGDGVTKRHWDAPEGDTSQPCGLNLYMYVHTQQPKCSLGGLREENILGKNTRAV